MARIAIVLNASWNIWNFRLPLLEYLAGQGHEIIAIAPEDAYSDRIPYEYHAVKMVSRSTSPAGDFHIYRDLKRVFKKTRPDVVLLYTIKPNVYGNVAARQLGIPTISNIAGLGNLFIHRSVVTYVARVLYRLALKHPSCVFFQNREDCQQFVTEGLVNPAQTQLLPGSGIDLERFRPSADLQLLTHSPFVFLLFSRMLWDKGVAEYAQAAKRLLSQGVNAEFRLLGVVDADNPKAITQQEMNDLVKDTGVVYLGSSDQVEQEICQADCIVLPTFYREGVPHTLLEAAAMEKPIIATNAVGCRDVVDDGETGFLCAPRDDDDLSNKMQAMIQLDNSERQAMGERGRKKMVREFDQKIVFVKYAQAIMDVLGKN